MQSGIREMVRDLQLKPHPEGGFYRETWRSGLSVRVRGYPGRRALATSILYLLPAGTVSRWHRVRSDELWGWQGGGTIELAELIAGRVRLVKLGPGSGSVLQHVVKGGRCFAARPARGARYALAGCIVAPGFDFRDFALADPAVLCWRFPRSAAAINAFAGAPRTGTRRR